MVLAHYQRVSVKIREKVHPVDNGVDGLGQFDPIGSI